MKSVCVYCGSNPGNKAAYADSAAALGRALVERELQLVYGGASVGIMGMVANSVMALGGKVVGVIPEELSRKELAHPSLTELHVTPSMHARKAMMAERSDAFLAMPGGIGTLEEIFEIWTWAQLGFHRKPCGLLNIDGYFDSLIQFLDHSVAEGFVNTTHRNMLMVESDPGVLLDRFSSYTAPEVQKWIEKT